MNAPLKPPVIAEILADACVSISNLKANPAAVIAEAQIRQVAILNRNRPVAYVISPGVWEHICDLFADHQLLREAEAALESDEEGVEVSLDDLL
ncbi:type II toxin-antitoxin system Phd/YefM family antitoxin [Novosphingobium colocasiae]|uniref:type II toxin-antitoxin system Phd/YefM family antitoxin n=1 Tax=Novosphingobium colocasiae TaxID=1256513 RepID=UPI0035B257D8